ncbi:C-_U-editing enzyme APOBEC-1 [Ochotona princeps]|uniref:C->U-editing enzyme APOBEC-1 n=1 Tax=Ochotona princeps TaxID=9978 RepID=UPI0027151550|nr:C->U-editing enzyme APOBEC-1 [Ochotona princeps]
MRILIHYRRRIEPWDFVESFEPRALRKETYLLYELRWTSGKIWRNANRNTTQHAEVNFIEKHISERRIRPSTNCCITWFLSWSPCWECAKVIKEFLSQHPRVTLVINAARLFYHTDPQNRQGLRDLVASGVTIKIMSMAEYRYCWEQFVNYPPGEEACCPRYTPEPMMMYALELLCIILNLPPCLKISKSHQNLLAFFNLTLQNCHYQRIPPDFLLTLGLVRPFVIWR